MLTLGFFYFSAGVWHWDATLNLSLAAAMNAVYVCGSLLAHGLAQRVGRRGSLGLLYSTMAVACAAAAMIASHLAISGCLLVYMFFNAMNWPMMESLCSTSSDAHEMSRRVGAYNLTWALAGAIAVLITGPLIEHWPAGMFLLPAILHATSAAIMLTRVRLDRPDHAIDAPAVIKPEPDLLCSRTLALWLSRSALPAMYVVNYSLGAILPTLAVVRSFSPAGQTFVGSIWVLARMGGFAFLGATLFWHTRPRLLLVASIALLLTFLMTTLPSSMVLIIAGQIFLGLAMAMIYTASLYFGMVLSDSSTEHGGYHEALIGLGGVLGPGAGAISQYFFPGDVRIAIAAVAGVVTLSVIGAAVASVGLRRD